MKVYLSFIIQCILLTSITIPIDTKISKQLNAEKVIEVYQCSFFLQIKQYLIDQDTQKQIGAENNNWYPLKIPTVTE